LSDPGEFQAEGACQCGSGRLSAMKFGEFLDWLKNCWLLMKDCALELVRSLFEVHGDKSAMYIRVTLY
jgi:hypothetical protein